MGVSLAFMSFLIMVSLWVPIVLETFALAKGFGEAIIGRKTREDDCDKGEK